MKIDTDKVTSIVKNAAVFFRDSHRIAQVDVKGYGNFVTEADKAVQQYIQQRLAEEYPEVAFFAEEKENGDVDITKDFWILDPIDGTLNLMHDFAHSAISLGYAENGRLESGIIYDPFRNEMFRARRGCGAYMMKEVSKASEEQMAAGNALEEPVKEGSAPSCVWFPIHVSRKETLQDSVILIGTAPYHRDELGDRYFETIHKVFMHCQDIRRFGAAVLDLAWVACGRADGYFEHVYPWDRAAGIVIVTEAGGRVCSFDGSEVPVTTFHDICAGSSGVADDIIKITKPIFSS